MSNEVILNNVSKAYGNNLVLNKLNLCVKDGELVSLLGSSGCGKTTALRIIAGFLTADTGRVMIGDTDCTYMPPNKRNTGMVFQSYALFPHMSVKENVGFGLKIQKTPSTEAALRIKEILMTTRLEEFADRYPRQLSGGQQQRVALARALVVRPRVLLLDEPLSNLDAKLRHEMRVEIRMLHEKYGLTTIFVTHDQEEALTMSDRIMGKLYRADRLARCLTTRKLDLLQILQRLGISLQDMCVKVDSLQMKGILYFCRQDAMKYLR